MTLFPTREVPPHKLVTRTVTVPVRWGQWCHVLDDQASIFFRSACRRSALGLLQLTCCTSNLQRFHWRAVITMTAMITVPPIKAMFERFMRAGHKIPATIHSNQILGTQPLSQPRICNEMNYLSRLAQTGLELLPIPGREYRA